MGFIHHYKSPLGGITLASDGEVLTGLWFDGQKHFAPKGDFTEQSLPVFVQAENWLDRYFAGQRPEDIPPLHVKDTVFRVTVWEILLSVPYGKTVTYGQIAALAAEKMGQGRMSARAVGGAVGRNPISLIIPCHRVIGANGSLTGYAGGIERKKRLLEIENADLSRPILLQSGTSL